ncbi:AraC family transcriptional regulator [Marinobacter sp. SS21]|uniref:AraC family transcriptional regulator n=1 Tax=Marinobacter sp. SS21 TaxID=2979460 RepID=UPI00232EBAF5|nr:AraC family transcriptional regulator [Marinobacter sp. SS21]MDC0661448.1 AraC family transcriptional regulator [Marinobacter sp. SS21]
MTSNADHTTLAAWPLAICRALAARGIPADPILAQVGLNRGELTAHPDGRVDIRLMTEFWNQVLAVTDDEAFGLTVARYVQPMHFRALGLLLHTTGNLEQALLKLSHYSALVSNSATTRIEQTPSCLGFCIAPIEGVTISAMAIDSFLATLALFAEQLGAEQPVLSSVELMRSHPESTAPWERFFKAPVRFGAERNALWLNRAQLNSPSVMGDPQLAAFNESVVKSYVDALQATPFSHRVKQLVAAQLQQGEPKIQRIAERLNLTERSLRRHLRQEGRTYRELVQQCRMEVAEHYLSHSDMSVTDIALSIGFSDTSNFSRAFARHAGKSPSEFRTRSRQA